MSKNSAKKLIWIAFLALILALVMTGCGTVTTEQSKNYLDGSGDTSSQDLSKYDDSDDVGSYDIDAGDSSAASSDSGSTASDGSSSGNGSTASATGQNGNGSSSSSSSNSANQPAAVAAENQSVNTSVTHKCTISIDCKTMLNNMNSVAENKKAIVPSDGVILAATSVTFYDGESVLDVLKRVTKKNNIQMEFKGSSGYGGAYVEGIANLYEFDCGNLSGWEYNVNGWYPNYGCGNYIVSDGDVIQWRYTCIKGDLE